MWTALGLCCVLWGAISTEPIRPDGPGDVPPAAADEIRRRGAMVEHVAGTQGVEDEVLLAFVEAVAPPPDDSHKWFFTLVVTRGCQWCEKMRAEFASSPYLACWVNTKEPKRSWAHWQVVQIEDKSQEWRWKNVRPTRFPTLIVQPPLNRSFGDPATVVFLNQGYLEPQKLDAEIRAAIREYTRKVAPQYRAWKVQRARERALAGGAIGQADATGQAADWRPPAPPPSPLPEPSAPFQVPPPATPTTPSPSGPAADNLAPLLVSLLVKLLPSFHTILLLLLAISNVWMLYRDLARQTGVRMLIDDQTAQQIVTVIRKVAGGSGGSQPPSPPGA